MKVRVAPTRCQGHTLCAMIAPEDFELGDIDGHARTKHRQVPSELWQQVRDAARSCPEQAIIFEVGRSAGPAKNGTGL